MADGIVQHVALRGLACAIPKDIVTLAEEEKTIDTKLPRRVEPILSLRERR
jgi:hypothetical protein